MIRRYRGALVNGDFGTALDLLHPGLVFYPPKQGLAFGRDDLRQMWSEPEEEREHLTSVLEPGEVEQLPDGRYFSTTRETMRWRESGEIAATVERGAVWRLDDGRIIEIRVFPSVAEARVAIEASA